MPPFHIKFKTWQYFENVQKFENAKMNQERKYDF